MRQSALPRRRCRQWALGPPRTDRLAHWHWVDLPGDRGIAHDPSVPVVRGDSIDGSVALIGYAIDPERPTASTAAIVQELADHADPVARAQRLAGRWVLYLHSRDRSMVLHDACGTRQLVWTTTSAGVSCASDASLLAELYGYKPDAETTRRYLESPQYLRQYEAWWPGTATPYREVRQLLPNHLLDLDRGACERYWPVDPITEISPDEAAAYGADMLRRLMQAAAHRFPLALAVTGGRDSRVLLGAAEAVGAECWNYVFDHPRGDTWRTDLEVSAELLRRRGQPRHVVRCPDQMSDAFGAVYRSSVSGPHEYWGELAEGLWHELPRGSVSVTGNVSEVVRTFHRWYGDHHVTPADLAVCNTARGNEWVAEQLAEWQHDAEPAASRAGIHLLDLFYWEQKMGRWQAQLQLERDVVHETFAPYNHRPLLETLLGTPERARRAPAYELHRKLIERLDPSLLEVPINPRRWRHRARSFLDRSARQTARRLGVYRRLRGTNA
jgi:hypothetical protein